MENARSENKKDKGCDFGYALAANSCEGANSVDACTVTAFDAITAFAVPDPNESSQIPSVFSGSGVRRIAPPDEPPSLLRISNCLFLPTLSAVDAAILMKDAKMSTPNIGAKSKRFPPPSPASEPWKIAALIKVRTAQPVFSTRFSSRTGRPGERSKGIQ